MGVEINTAKFLVSSYDKKKPYEKVITLGRQNVLIEPDRLQKLLETSGVIHQFKKERCDVRYADFLFKLMGSTQVSSIDFSDYEGATVLHDMNNAITENLKNQYDLVFDGGTLEHVFNFPIALKNCLEMVKVGGHVIICTPANNMCGHGFYQFSPELFFRVFSEANGFKIIRMVAVDMDTEEWFNVTDPEKIRSRVELINFHPVSLYVEALKISNVEIFKIFPQQSDYIVSWAESEPLAEKLKKINPQRKLFPLRVALKKRFTFFYDFLKLLLKKTNNLKDQRFYHLIKDDKK